MKYTFLGIENRIYLFRKFYDTVNYFYEGIIKMEKSECLWRKIYIKEKINLTTSVPQGFHFFLINGRNLL